MEDHVPREIQQCQPQGKNRAHLPMTSPGSRSSIPVFVMDVLQADFPPALHVQGLEALEEPPLIALAQIVAVATEWLITHHCLWRFENHFLVLKQT